jgi:ABC-type proline/glycine betaine transport system ATPase subunit
MEVPKFKVTGIIGPNGSGKTTLFNVINGFLPPEKGQILFEDRDITRLKPHVTSRLGIGRTFQIPQVFSNMTVLENIMIGAFNRGGNVDKAYAEAEDCPANGTLQPSLWSGGWPDHVGNQDLRILPGPGNSAETTPCGRAYGRPESGGVKPDRGDHQGYR